MTIAALPLIEAKLDSPLILSPEAYLTLDSLLSAACQLFGEDGQQLPLKNTDGVFHGSAVMMVGRPVVNEAAFVSRMTIDDFSHPRIIPNRRKKMAVKMTCFPDKPRLDRYQAFHVPAVAWFAFGDPGNAIALLRRLPGLGKRCHTGYGQVSAYSATEMAHDHAWVLPDASPARPLPVGLCRHIGLDPGQLVIDRATFKPDYFDFNHAGLCALPTTRFISREHIDFLTQDLQSGQGK